MKAQVLKILKNNKDYVSGQKLCELFKVSRTYIWKIIKQLREEGYNIEAISNKGYKLIDSPDLINNEELESIIDTKYIAKKIYFYEELDSTNIEAKKIAENGGENGTLIITEKQTLGKGRRGRGWISPSGVNIYMSLILKPNIYPKCASMITLITALAVQNAIQDITKLDTFIKWPNDIVINSKKVCGILTEMSADMDNINYIVTGIGINVNIQYFEKDIKNIATSLYIETKEKIKRSILIAQIMKQFEYYYEIFLKTSDLSKLEKEYNNKLINLNRQVKIIEQNKEYKAISKGINEKGELIVEEDGIEKKVISGEVSVRGVYEYV